MPPGMHMETTIYLLTINGKGQEPHPNPVSSHNLPVFLCSLATAGSGYGLLFSGATELTSVAAPPLHSGGMFSALCLFAYLSLGSVAVALGAVATAKSLIFALNLGAAMIGALSLGALVLLASTFWTVANPP